METGRLFTVQEGRFSWVISDISGPFFLRDSILKSRSFTFSGSEYYMSVRRGTSVDLFSVSFSQCDDSPPQSLIVRIGLKFKNRIEKVSTRMHKKNKEFGLGDWMDDIPELLGTGQNFGRLIICCELKKLNKEKTLVLQEKIPKVEDSDEEETDVEDSDEGETDVEDSDEGETDSEYENLTKLQKDLNNLFKSGEDCDVTIKVQNKEFPAHRNILRARSPVFKSMFSHETQENLSGVAVIDDCDPGSFCDFLNYLYTGSTHHISVKNVCHLFKASDKYQVEELREECLEFMESHLSVETFCDFFTLALMYTVRELINSATEFFIDNVAKIAKTAKWQIFLKENSTAGNELFLKFLKTI